MKKKKKDSFFILEKSRKYMERKGVGG